MKQRTHVTHIVTCELSNIDNPDQSTSLIDISNQQPQAFVQSEPSLQLNMHRYGNTEGVKRAIEL